MKHAAAVLLGVVLSCALAAGQETASVCPLPGSGLSQGLFSLREMDLHLHAGMERPVDLDKWVNLAAQDGRRVIVLLDHLELYRKTPEEYAAWRAEKKFSAEYPVGEAGHAALMADFSAVAARHPELTIFKGWEVSETELDEGSEPEALHRADMIGWHISPRNGGTAPDGQHLLKRARQVLAIQQDYPVPMVLFHPFTMRLENLQRTAEKAGQDKSSLTVEEYRFFQPGEQKELASLLRGSSVYVEISSATTQYWEDPICREALIADIRPLAQLGVQFIVSTDNHGLSSAEKPFQPETYCEAFSVTPLNTNAMVRELLAIRAKTAGQ